MALHVRRTVVLCALFASSSVASAATCPVTTLADTGAGSLREALNCSNAATAPSVIQIQVTGTLTLASLLPDVTSPVRILGPSGGFVVDGSGLAGGFGLSIKADRTVLRDTTWTGFTTGVVVEDATEVVLRRNELLDNDVFGVWLKGQTDDVLLMSNRVAGNASHGVLIDSVIGSGTEGGMMVYNTIADNGSDGVFVGNRDGFSLIYNSIQSSVGDGIHAESSVNLRIHGNEIGTDPTFADLGNGGDGIHITAGSTDFDILDNRIAYNGGSGIAAAPAGPVGGHIIQGNLVGGEGAGNGAHGILLSHTASDCLVGGSTPGHGNEIVGNQLDGIHVDVAADRNTFSRNTIRDQSGASIQLDGGNAGAVAPRILSVQGSTLSIHTSQADDVAVEVFMAEPDGTEAWLYLGDATQVGPQEWSFDAPAFLDHFVVVATDSDGNSTGLGRDVGLDLTVTHTGDSGSGSLRNAIEFANSGGIPAEILFDIPGLSAVHDGSGSPPPLVFAVLSPYEDVVIPLSSGACGTAGGIVLDGGGTVGNGLWFRSTAAGSVLKCFGFRGFPNSGVVSQAEDMVFDRVTVHDSGNGMALQAARPVLIGVDLSYNGSGLEVENTHGIDVSDSLFEHNELSGITLLQVDGASVRDSVLAGNGQYGISTTHVSDVEILGNRASGNGCTGIFLSRADGTNFIQGNVVGLDETSTIAEPNGANHDQCFGISLDFNGGFVGIGGSRALGLGNVVVGNTHGGIHVTRSNVVHVLGNDVGVTADLTLMGNGGDGIDISNQVIRAVVGASGAGNRVGDNDGHGIHLSHTPGSDTSVWANDVGTNDAGLDFGNALSGIQVESDDDWIGDNGSDRNLIGFNHGAGIATGDLAGGTLLRGNQIGVTASGVAVPNQGPGIELAGTGAQAQYNIVENNGDVGIRVTSTGSENTLLANRITHNTGKAIELETVGAATGNQAMPAPVFTHVDPQLTQLVLTGTSDADGDVVQVFLSDGPQSALVYVGATTQAGGSWQMVLPDGVVYDATASQTWVALATGRSSTLNSSELSDPVTVATDAVCDLFLPETIQVCAGESVALGAGLRCGNGCAAPNPTPIDCTTGCTSIGVGSGHLNINPGDVVCTPEGTTFTGAAHLNGGTWKVCGEAPVSDLNLNGGSLEVAGTLDALGTYKILHAGSNLDILVTGRLALPSLYTSGTLTNQGEVWIRSFSPRNGSVTANEGRMGTRYADIDGYVINFGSLYASARMTVTQNNTGELINACSLDSGPSFVNYHRFRNDGFMTVSELFEQHRGYAALLPGSRIETGWFRARSGRVIGGATCAAVSAHHTQLHASSSVDGAIDLCDPDGFEQDDGFVGPEVTTDCSCDVPRVSNPTFSWSPAAGLDDATAETPMASPTADTTYNVVVTGPDGLLAAESVTIEVVSCPP